MIFIRTQSLPKAVAEIRRESESLKTSQIVGNDNLVVYAYPAFISGPIYVPASTVAKFRATFVFDNPSVTYVPLTFYWTSQDSFLLQETFYDDPATINSTVMQRRFINISPSANMNMDFIQVSAKSTETGVLTLKK